MGPRRIYALFFAAAVLYTVCPGHPLLPLNGLPIGPWGAAVGTAAVVVLTFLRDRPHRESTGLWARESSRLLVALLCLVALKWVVASLSPHVGWLARYYANDAFRPPHEVSTAFPSLEATRIDRSIFFKGDSFPLYFLNDARFNRGIRREVTEPFSIRWTGHALGEQVVRRTVTLTARGRAYLRLDGAEVLTVDSMPEIGHSTGTIALSEGPHLLEVGYQKPANADGLIQLQWNADDAAAPVVSPRPYSRVQLRTGDVSWYVAMGLHLLAATVFLRFVMLLAGWTLSRPSPQVAWRDDQSRAERKLYLLLLTGLCIQGFWSSAHLIGRALTLSGGDDWLAFEGRAREVLTGGLLMRFGAPWGAGDAFYYYPFYSYFIAFVHRLVGEDLFGVIYVHFLLLALTNIVLYRLAKELFGARTALCAVLAVVVIEQLDFIRHYTVTLLTENLYFFTVTLTVYLLVSFTRTRKRWHLVTAGILGGVSSLTRTSMLIYFLPSLVPVVLARPAARKAFSWLAAAVAVYTWSWFGVVSLATIRNYLVSGRWVLITADQGWSVVLYNLPSFPDAGHHYGQMFTGSLFSGLKILVRILIDHPVEFLGGLYVKIMFSLGMIHWMGGRPHPELVLVSAAYFLSIMFCPAARSFKTWPVHLFIWTHLLSLTLTMPSNYGYRLILPMYLFMPIFASALALAAWSKGIQWMSAQRAKPRREYTGSIP